MGGCIRFEWPWSGAPGWQEGSTARLSPSAWLAVTVSSWKRQEEGEGRLHPHCGYRSSLGTEDSLLGFAVPIPQSCFLPALLQPFYLNPS